MNKFTCHKPWFFAQGFVISFGKVPAVKFKGCETAGKLSISRQAAVVLLGCSHGKGLANPYLETVPASHAEKFPYPLNY